MIYYKQWSPPLIMSKYVRTAYLGKEKAFQDIQEIILRTLTNRKSLSTCITISHDWKGFPLHLLTYFTALLFPGPKADTTGEHIKDALSRKMRSICGRNGPPSTTWTFQPLNKVKIKFQIWKTKEYELFSFLGKKKRNTQRFGGNIKPTMIIIIFIETTIDVAVADKD